MRHEHCKGCAHFHNAGHGKDAKHLQRYNAWCCAKGAPAAQSVGWCKTHNMKNESQAAQYLQTVGTGLVVDERV